MSKEYNIVVLPGDHAGPEVISEALKVLDKVQELAPAVKFTCKKMPFGGNAIDDFGISLPQQTLDACLSSDAVLLGSVGGPKWGAGAVRPEQGILDLRKHLNLYSNIRPALFPSDALLPCSPIKEEYCKGTEVIVLRENTGGIYYGEKKDLPKDAKEGLSYDRCDYTIEEIERVARVGGLMARQHKPAPYVVHSIDKANVMATSRTWRNVVSRIFAEEFPDIELKHQLADSAAMILASRPSKLNGILLADNLFGDLLSDEASVIPGSLGLLPSASLNGFPDGKSKPIGVYEPIHGSAPDISGQGIVNPVATILSVALMLRYSFSLEKHAKAIEDAVRKALDSKESGGYALWTADLGGKAKTTEVTDGVLKALEETLKA